MAATVRPFGSVTVFGGATVDRVARSAAAPVMGASNPGTVRRLAGGVGLNVATVLAGLGMPTRIVTAVGDDPDGGMVISAAASAGIDTDGFIVVAGSATAGYHATLDDHGNLIVGIADMGICDAITPAAVAPAAGSAGEDDFWVLDANLPEETLDFLVTEARSSRRPTAALAVSPAKVVRLMPLLDELSYLFANRREAAALLDGEPRDAAEAAWALSGHRATNVVVTDGGEPLAAAGGGEVRSFAPLRAAVKAVNGAGDSLAAGTILGLSAGHSLNDAVRFGLAAAALTLEAGSIAAASFSPDRLAERMAGPPGRRAAS